MSNVSGATAPGAQAPLVNNTKLRTFRNAKSTVPDEKNGDNAGFVNDFDKYTNQRFVRYQMQAAAKYILPRHRISHCLRHQVTPYGDVNVFKHRSTQRAFYGGLMVCSSVWVCPVCAAKISERRRQELKTVFKAHLDAGGYCTMVTLTFSHSIRDKLDDLLLALGKSMQDFSRGGRDRAFRKEIGLVGKIRAFEITYGVNGWHPHIHLLLLHNNEIEPWDQEDMKYRLYSMWSAACAKNGLETSYEHGLSLDDAAEASQYIGKWGDIMDKPWGTDSEMTKANIKKGRSGSMTPFDMLRAIVEDGDLEYEPKYKEYAAATKGKQQLVWSPGLKAKYLIEDKTDEEVATEKVEEADLLGLLSWKDWRYILQNGLRVTLLDYIEKFGYETALHNIGLQKEKPTD